MYETKSYHIKSDNIESHENLLQYCFDYITQHFTDFHYNDFLSGYVKHPLTFAIDIILIEKDNKIVALSILVYYKLNNMFVISNITCKSKGDKASKAIWFYSASKSILFKLKNLSKKVYLLNLAISPLTYCYMMEKGFRVYPHPNRKMSKSIWADYQHIIKMLNKKVDKSNPFLAYSATRSIDSDDTWLAQNIRKESAKYFEYFIKNVPNKKNSADKYGLFALFPLDITNIIALIYKESIVKAISKFIRKLTRRKAKDKLIDLYRTKSENSSYHHFSKKIYNSEEKRIVKDELGNIILDMNPSALGIQKDSFLDVFINNSSAPWHQPLNITSDSEEAEKDVIEIMSNYYCQDKEKLRGHITNNSSDSNICALWYARELLISNKDSRVLFIYCDNAHYSIAKAAHLLSLNTTVLNTTRQECFALDKLHSTILQAQKDGFNKFIFNFTIGTDKFGAVDDIPAALSIIQSILNKKDCYIHADGSNLGMLIPIFDLIKTDTNLFEYIDSITISSHKIFGTLSLSSILLVQNNTYQAVCDKVKTIFNDTFHPKDMTLTGAANRFNIIELHYLIKKLRLDDDAKPLFALTKKALENAQYFFSKVTHVVDQEMVTYHKNQLNIIFPRTRDSLGTDFLSNKYSLFSSCDSDFVAHISPQVSRSDIDEFIEDYSGIVSIYGLHSAPTTSKKS